MYDKIFDRIESGNYIVFSDSETGNGVSYKDIEKETFIQFIKELRQHDFVLRISGDNYLTSDAIKNEFKYIRNIDDEILLQLIPILYTEYVMYVKQKRFNRVFEIIEELVVLTNKKINDIVDW